MERDERQSDGDVDNKEVHQALAKLHHVKSQPNLRERVLRQMLEASASGGEGRGRKLTSKHIPLWRRSIRVPMPVLAAILLVVMWLGWQSFYRVSGSIDAPSKQLKITERLPTKAPTVSLELTRQIDKDALESSGHGEVAFYIPTIGFDVRQETNYIGKE